VGALATDKGQRAVRPRSRGELDISGAN